MKKVLLGVICIMLFSGCSEFYDNVGKPVYKGIKTGVKTSHISEKTLERLKRIDEKATSYDTVRGIVKPLKGAKSH